MQLVRTLAWSMAEFYPPRVRKQIEREMPTLVTQAARLALEVMDAEARGIRFAEAALRPDFPLMGRVHFGVIDTLRNKIPSQLRQPLREMLRASVRGDFDDLRQLTFAIASQRNDPEAALCRYLLWEAIRMNLFVLTWGEPKAEATGALADAELEDEKTIRAMLRVPAMFEDGLRPLHVLIAEAMVRLTELTRERLREIGLRPTDLTEELMHTVEELHAVRALEAADAAALCPGPMNGPAGGQQVADRYPQHFRNANAVHQRNRRARRKLGRPPSGDRFIDLIREQISLEDVS